MYNVIPWLAAIPLAVSGGYVSDFLINKGIKPHLKLVCVLCHLSVIIKQDTCSDLVSFAFSLGYRVSFVRKLMQVNIELLLKRWLFMLHFFAFKHAITRLTKASPRQRSPVKQRLHLSNVWFSFAELKTVEIILICVSDFL